MQTTPDIAIILAVLLPFLAAAVAPWVQRWFGVLAGGILALAPAAAFLALWGMLPAIEAGERVAVAFAWAPSWGLTLGFMVDGLSLTFSLTIAAIGALILLYAGAYLKGHQHHGRFFAFMLLFMGAMQGVVLSDNLVALYLFWELTSVASFLLIGFDHARPAARRAAVQALVVTGAGGLALLAAGILIHALSGTWTLSEVTTDLRGDLLYLWIALPVLFAAFTKSGQVPFHFWLPNAMEAPTPVSAYLHSAAMVQAGVYLVMRMTPMLGGEAIWNGALVVFGGATLLWGSVGALRQTDMKQVLAQTTLASLGLSMLLLGIGNETAFAAAVLYFLAHAGYKAALFMVAGAIDHETGTRELTALGGLRDRLTITFIGAIMAGIAMLGLPPLLGFLAKEEMYAAVLAGDPGSVAALVVLVAGNAALGAVGLALMLKPFMGQLIATPKDPHEAPVAMLTGPLVLGTLGIGLGFVPVALGVALLAPATSAIMGETVVSHLKPGIHFDAPAFWLSVVTWALALGLFARLDATRLLLRRGLDRLWSADRAFDGFYFGLVRLSAAATRALHHGRLEFYLSVVFVLLAAAAVLPLWLLGGWPGLPAMPELAFYEWGVVGMALLGVVVLVGARERLFAILALGIQGIAVALLYLLLGAPDLSFTQFMVEILSVVILALVMTRLRLDANDPRPLEDWLRDGAIALAGGLAVTALLFAVLEGTLDTKLADFFNTHSVPIAHGHNMVNVILVDFRGLDTLGEISVVMAAGIAILALLRGSRKAPPPSPAVPEETLKPEAAKKPRARRTRKAATA